MIFVEPDIDCFRIRFNKLSLPNEVLQLESQSIARTDGDNVEKAATAPSKYPAEEGEKASHSASTNGGPIPFSTVSLEERAEAVQRALLSALHERYTYEDKDSLENAYLLVITHTALPSMTQQPLSCKEMAELMSYDQFLPTSLRQRTFPSHLQILLEDTVETVQTTGSEMGAGASSKQGPVEDDARRGEGVINEPSPTVSCAAVNSPVISPCEPEAAREGEEKKMSGAASSEPLAEMSNGNPSKGAEAMDSVTNPQMFDTYYLVVRDLTEAQHETYYRAHLHDGAVLGISTLGMPSASSPFVAAQAPGAKSTSTSTTSVGKAMNGFTVIDGAYTHYVQASDEQLGEACSNPSDAHKKEDTVHQLGAGFEECRAEHIDNQRLRSSKEVKDGKLEAREASRSLRFSLYRIPLCRFTAQEQDFYTRKREQLRFHQQRDYNHMKRRQASYSATTSKGKGILGHLSVVGGNSFADAAEDVDRIHPSDSVMREMLAAELPERYSIEEKDQAQRFFLKCNQILTNHIHARVPQLTTAPTPKDSVESAAGVQENASSAALPTKENTRKCDSAVAPSDSSVEGSLQNQDSAGLQPKAKRGPPAHLLKRLQRKTAVGASAVDGKDADEGADPHKNDAALASGAGAPREEKETEKQYLGYGNEEPVDTVARRQPFPNVLFHGVTRLLYSLAACDCYHMVVSHCNPLYYAKSSRAAYKPFTISLTLISDLTSSGTPLQSMGKGEKHHAPTTNMAFTEDNLTMRGSGSTVFPFLQSSRPTFTPSHRTTGERSPPPNVANTVLLLPEDSVRTNSVHHPEFLLPGLSDAGLVLSNAPSRAQSPDPAPRRSSSNKASPHLQEASKTSCERSRSARFSQLTSPTDGFLSLTVTLCCNNISGNPKHEIKSLYQKGARLPTCVTGNETENECATGVPPPSSSPNSHGVVNLFQLLSTSSLAQHKLRMGVIRPVISVAVLDGSRIGTWEDEERPTLFTSPEKTRSSEYCCRGLMDHTWFSPIVQHTPHEQEAIQWLPVILGATDCVSDVGYRSTVHLGLFRTPDLSGKNGGEVTSQSLRPSTVENPPATGSVLTKKDVLSSLGVVSSKTTEPTRTAPDTLTPALPCAQRRALERRDENVVLPISAGKPEADDATSVAHKVATENKNLAGSSATLEATRKRGVAFTVGTDARNDDKAADQEDKEARTTRGAVATRRAAGGVAMTFDLTPAADGDGKKRSNTVRTPRRIASQRAPLLSGSSRGVVERAAESNTQSSVLSTASSFGAPLSRLVKSPRPSVSPDGLSERGPAHADGLPFDEIPVGGTREKKTVRHDDIPVGGFGGLHGGSNPFSRSTEDVRGGFGRGATRLDDATDDTLAQLSRRSVPVNATLDSNHQGTFLPSSKKSINWDDQPVGPCKSSSVYENWDDVPVGGHKRVEHIDKEQTFISGAPSANVCRGETHMRSSGSFRLPFGTHTPLRNAGVEPMPSSSPHPYRPTASPFSISTVNRTGMHPPDPVWPSSVRRAGGTAWSGSRSTVMGGRRCSPESRDYGRNSNTGNSFNEYWGSASASHTGGSFLRSNAPAEPRSTTTGGSGHFALAANTACNGNVRIDSPMPPSRFGRSSGIVGGPHSQHTYCNNGACRGTTTLTSDAYAPQKERQTRELRFSNDPFSSLSALSTSALSGCSTQRFRDVESTQHLYQRPTAPYRRPPFCSNVGSSAPFRSECGYDGAAPHTDPTTPFSSIKSALFSVGGDGRSTVYVDEYEDIPRHGVNRVRHRGTTAMDPVWSRPMHEYNALCGQRRSVRSTIGDSNCSTMFTERNEHLRDDRWTSTRRTSNFLHTNTATQSASIGNATRDTATSLWPPMRSSRPPIRPDYATTQLHDVGTAKPSAPTSLKGSGLDVHQRVGLRMLQNRRQQKLAEYSSALHTNYMMGSPSKRVRLETKLPSTTLPSSITSLPATEKAANSFRTAERRTLDKAISTEQERMERRAQARSLGLSDDETTKQHMSSRFLDANYCDHYLKEGRRLAYLTDTVGQTDEGVNVSFSLRDIANALLLLPLGAAAQQDICKAAWQGEGVSYFLSRPSSRMRGGWGRYMEQLNLYQEPFYLREQAFIMVLRVPHLPHLRVCVALHNIDDLVSLLYETPLSTRLAIKDHPCDQSEVCNSRRTVSEVEKSVEQVEGVEYCWFGLLTKRYVRTRPTTGELPEARSSRWWKFSFLRRGKRASERSTNGESPVEGLSLSSRHRLRLALAQARATLHCRQLHECTSPLLTDPKAFEARMSLLSERVAAYAAVRHRIITLQTVQKEYTAQRAKQMARDRIFKICARGADEHSPQLGKRIPTSRTAGASRPASTTPSARDLLRARMKYNPRRTLTSSGVRASSVRRQGTNSALHSESRFPVGGGVSRFGQGTTRAVFTTPPRTAKGDETMQYHGTGVESNSITQKSAIQHHGGGVLSAFSAYKAPADGYGSTADVGVTQPTEEHRSRGGVMFSFDVTPKSSRPPALPPFGTSRRGFTNRNHQRPESLATREPFCRQGKREPFRVNRIADGNATNLSVLKRRLLLREGTAASPMGHDSSTIAPYAAPMDLTPSRRGDQLLKSARDALKSYEETDLARLDDVLRVQKDDTILRAFQHIEAHKVSNVAPPLTTVLSLVPRSEQVQLLETRENAPLYAGFIPSPVEVHRQLEVYNISIVQLRQLLQWQWEHFQHSYELVPLPVYCESLTTPGCRNSSLGGASNYFPFSKQADVRKKMSPLARVLLLSYAKWSWLMPLDYDACQGNEGLFFLTGDVDSCLSLRLSHWTSWKHVVCFYLVLAYPCKAFLGALMCTVAYFIYSAVSRVFGLPTWPGVRHGSRRVAVPYHPSENMLPPLDTGESIIYRQSEGATEAMLERRHDFYHQAQVTHTLQVQSALCSLWSRFSLLVSGHSPILSLQVSLLCFSYVALFIIYNYILQDIISTALGHVQSIVFHVAYQLWALMGLIYYCITDSGVLRLVAQTAVRMFSPPVTSPSAASHPTPFGRRFVQNGIEYFYAESDDGALGGGTEAPAPAQSEVPFTPLVGGHKSEAANVTSSTVHWRASASPPESGLLGFIFLCYVVTCMLPLSPMRCLWRWVWRTFVRDDALARRPILSF